LLVAVAVPLYNETSFEAALTKGGAMRTYVVVAVLACALAIAASNALAENPDPKPSRDYPLYEAPEYNNASCIYVTFYVLGASRYSFSMSVDINTIDVQLRTDGGDYTSLFCRGITEAGGSCTSATILVPVKEDVETWRAEVKRWKELRKKYLDSLPKPRRILPKKR